MHHVAGWTRCAKAMRFHLTAAATAHGFAYAVPATFTGIVGYGRAERSSADQP
jgi:hypothetical protein